MDTTTFPYDISRTTLQEFDAVLATLRSIERGSRRGVAHHFRNSTFGRLLELFEKTPIRNYYDMSDHEQTIVWLPTGEMAQAQRIYGLIKTKFDAPIVCEAYELQSDLTRLVRTKLRAVAVGAPFTLMAAWVGYLIAELPEHAGAEEIAMELSQHDCDGDVGTRVFSNIVESCFADKSIETMAYSIDPATDLHRLLTISKMIKGDEAPWIAGYRRAVAAFGPNMSVFECTTKHGVDL